MKPPLNGTDPVPYVEQSVSSGGAQPSAKAIYEQRKNYAKSVAVMGEVSEYRVDHLATFPMERKEAILTVDDSIRKLKLLDARGKVWTQEIFLYVDDKSIKLVDCESREELEHFPLVAIQHIQSVIDSCNYNSICAVVIKDSDQKNPDIYLFQCSVVPADVICADVSSAWQDFKSKKGMKSRPDTLRRHRETIEASTRPPMTPPINVKDRVAEWTNAIEAQNDIPSLSPRGSLAPQHEDSAEMIAFRIHRDVQMLNHGLDDIELFVSLLQKSAEATRELTVRQSKRKSSRKGGKNRAPGSGLMELRSRLPPKEQFIDCFQKFRFCFNLLAKLKAQIKDPNAVELVHFLFQPLGKIIHTCCGPDLARTVQFPLHNRDTIEFLQNCATTQELQLWRDLGEYWTKSRGEFPKEMYFPPYIPHFTSGWEPPPIPFMEAGARELAVAIQEHADHVHRAEEAWKAGGANIEDALKPLSPMSHPEPSGLRRMSSQHNGNHEASAAFKEHVQKHVARNQAAQSSMSAQPRKLCRAMYDFSARNEHELSVKLDDLLDVIDDSKGWWKVQNDKGETGHVPENLMLLISSATKPVVDNPPAFIPPPPEIKASTIPPAPPIFQVPPAPTASIAPVNKLQPVPKLSSVVLRKTPVVEKPTRNQFSSESLQEELRQRVATQKPRNFVIPKKSSASSSTLMVNKSSTPQEISHWLTSQGFSQLTVDSLGVLNGAQIFSLTKDELKQVCEEEGSRVHSKLLVQRSEVGFGTTKESSELGKIMRKRQEITENHF